jgi:plastocyanin
MPYPIRAGRARTALAVSALALAALAGCSDSDSGGSAPASSKSASQAPPSGASSAASQPAKGQAKIGINNFTFSPAKLTVAPGAKVTVMNSDSTTHTVTATGGGGSFDTGDIASGKTATFTAPTKAGDYPYDCSIHPFMKGTLTVS